LDVLPTALAEAGVIVDDSLRPDGVNLLPLVECASGTLEHNRLALAFEELAAILGQPDANWG
jgi:hypothetical protein